MKGPKPQPTAARFWRYVKLVPRACWLWTGGRTRGGYGAFRTSQPRRTVRAHRMAWELLWGPIPEGKCVLHKCDTPLCVRPSHLFLGTVQENTDDMIAKGRGAKGERMNMGKITEQAVREIRASREPLKVLAARYGIHPVHAGLIRRGKSWRHVK